MPTQAELLDRVFRDPGVKYGLRFFTKGERNRTKLREADDARVEIFCAKREKWLRAKPEEVVRQLFLVWVQETLKYPPRRVLVEWPIQMGEDEEKERADIAIFTDDACTDPYLVFELKRPDSKEGLEQLRSYLRWTGCFFGCWSNGSDRSFQLKEEHKDTKKGPYTFRDIPRLPKLDEDLDAILKPLTFAELNPIQDNRISATDGLAAITASPLRTRRRSVYPEPAEGPSPPLWRTSLAARRHMHTS